MSENTTTVVLERSSVIFIHVIESAMKNTSINQKAKLVSSPSVIINSGKFDCYSISAFIFRDSQHLQRIPGKTGSGFSCQGRSLLSETIKIYMRSVHFLDLSVKRMWKLECL